MTEEYTVGFPVSPERHVQLRALWPLTIREWTRMMVLLEDMRPDLTEEPAAKFTVAGPVRDGDNGDLVDGTDDERQGLPNPEPKP